MNSYKLTRLVSMAILPAFIFQSCIKKRFEEIDDAYDQAKMGYTVDGLKNITLNAKDDSATIDIEVALTKGMPSDVKLELLGTPSYVTHSFSKNDSKPPYSSTLTFKSKNATPGRYVLPFNTYDMSFSTMGTQDSLVLELK